MSEDGKVVRVKCGVQTCEQQVRITRRDLRQMVDDNRVPICQLCTKAAAMRERASSRPEKERVEDAIMTVLFRARGPVDLPDLIVECWNINPKKIGLRKYEEAYPDAKKVELALVRLVQQRQVFRPRPAMFQITDLAAENLYRQLDVKETA